MEFIYNDGGRSKYFQVKHVGDCGVRSICNATGLDYKLVYDCINKIAKGERTGKRKRSVSTARDGVYRPTYKALVEGLLGCQWHATMTIGSGCRTHLQEDELPRGVIMVNLSKHYSCVKDGVIYDTYNCSRGENRCVYGYWTLPYNWDLAKATKKLEEFLNGKPSAKKTVSKPVEPKVEQIPQPTSEEAKKALSALKRKQTALAKALKEKASVERRIKKLKKEIKSMEKSIH